MINLKQGTPEWLAFRKSHITATDIAPILGVCPWEETAYTLFFEKKDPEIHQKNNPYIEWGSRLEASIIDKLTEELGILNVKRGLCYDVDWKMASLDGEGDLAGQHVIIEAKTTSHRDGWWDEEGNETIPLHYQLQATWQMIVTGYRKVVFSVLRSGNDWWYRVFEYNESMASDCLKAANEFFLQVLKNEEPKCSEQKYAAAAEAERKLRQQKIEEDNTSKDVSYDILSWFISAKKDLDLAERQYSNAQNALLEAMAGSRVATIKDRPIVKLVKCGRGLKYTVVGILSEDDIA